MKRLILLVLLFTFKSYGWAQVNQCPEQFKAYNNTGQEVTRFCVGQPIRFKSCLSNTQPDKEYYDFDKSNGLSFSTDTTKSTVYTRPGTYTVTQLINTGQISQKERTFIVVDTPPPVFTAEACAQNQVRVTITDKNYDNFLVDFGDGTKINLAKDASTVHQYSPGTPLKIRVEASYSNATCTQEAEVTLQPLPVPTTPLLEGIQITSPGTSGKLTLNIRNLQRDYIYVLEQITGSSATPIQTFLNPADASLNYTINDVNTSNPLCFRIRVTDKCNSNLNMDENTICSQPLTATAGNNQVNLSWPTYQGLSNLENYQLFRNGTLLQTFPVNTNAFTDDQVVCGTNYCYQVKAILKNNSSSNSNDACLTVVTTNAPPPGFLSSTFTPSNQVELTFTTAGNSISKTITYQKSSISTTFNTLATTDKTTLTDANVNLENSRFCYQGIYEDNCGKVSGISNTTCPIILKAILTPDNIINLNWTEYVGFVQGSPSYVVEFLDINGTILSSTSVSGTTYSQKINLTQQQQYYRIKATGGNAAEISFSNTVLIQQESNFRIPNAFSPNGDGLNDFFEIKGNIFGDFRLQILDRWGQELFSSNDQQNGWNGTIKGQDAPVGVYVYSFKATDGTGKTITKSGTVTLVR